MTVGYKSFLWFCWCWWRGSVGFPCLSCVGRSVARSAGPVGGSAVGVVSICRCRASAVLRAFYNDLVTWWRWRCWRSPLFCWWWIASAAGRGSWASVGHCDGLRGWAWALALSSFRGAVTGFYGFSCGRWWAFSRALVLVVALVPGRCSSAVVAFLDF